jgi:LPS sulfotransferase NodH
MDTVPESNNISVAELKLLNIRKSNNELVRLSKAAIYESRFYLAYPFRRKRTSAGKFLIFTFQRTGSTLLVDLLDSHPEIQCEGEILLHRKFLPRTYLSYKAQISPKSTFGFKLITSHFIYQGMANPDDFIRYLSASDFKFILLSRRNIVRAAISLYLAVQSGKFHHYKDELHRPDQKVNLSQPELFHYIDWLEKNRRFLEQLTHDIPHISFIYEDDLLTSEKQQATVDSICRYLNVDPCQAKTQLLRSPKENTFDRVQNLEEVVSWLLRSPYSDMADFS